MRARFGTAGNPEGFYAAGKKQSKQMPGWLRERGLDAYEYQCGKGVTVGEATARAIGQAAAQAGIALSLHAPYFVNPANPEPDSQAKTAGYVLEMCIRDRVTPLFGLLSTMVVESRMAFFSDALEMCIRDSPKANMVCPAPMGRALYTIKLA